MKRVSFEVAEYIKKIGYPQDYIEYYYDYNECMQKRDKCYVNCQCVAPTYFDVMCWLMDTRNIYIFVQKISKDSKSCCYIYQDCNCEYEYFDDWYEAFEWGIKQSIKKL